MPTSPLIHLNVGDVVGLFLGPQIAVNYIGSAGASCSVTLAGTGTVTVQYNNKALVVDSTPTPNPGAWQTIRIINAVGTTVVPLSPRLEQSWIRLIVASTGTGSCEITAAWALPGSVIDPLVYLGTWDASANTPTLASGVGLKGGYYIVIVPGTTTLDGISSWAVGDQLVFNRTAWIKQPALVVNATT